MMRTTPELMRPISILNSESRLFWTIFQRRLSSFLLKNSYIQLKVQKAFLHGVAGCIEHATVLANYFVMLVIAKLVFVFLGWILRTLMVPLATC